MRKLVYILIFVLLSLTVKADIKQLLEELKKDHCDTAKVSLLLKISEELISNDLTRSADYAKKAYELALESNDTNKIISSSLAYGINQTMAGNQKEALRLFYDGLDYAIKTKNKHLQIRFFGNIGNCFGYLQDYKSAIKYYNDALELAYELNNDLLISKSENNVGHALYMLKDYEKSLEKFLIALEINKKLNYQDGLLFNYSNIGNAYLKLNNTIEAEKNLLIHFDLAKQFNHKIHVVWAHEYLSQLYLKRRLYSYALLHADSVIESATKMNYSEILPNGYNTRSQVNFKLKRYKEAYEDLAKKVVHTDSLEQLEKADIIEEIRVQNKYAKQIKNLKLEKENAVLLQKETRFNIIVLGLVLLAIILIGTLVIINNRNKIKASKLQQKLLQKENEAVTHKNRTFELEIKQKNNELASNVLHLTKMNDLVNSISAKLEEKKKDFKNENITEVNKIIKNIQSNSNSSLWKEFEVRFNSIHAGFYENIQKDFKLTTNEKKLCAFLKLNMSSKEISEITGQSVHSIEVARTRFRKKLGLANTDETLTDFLNKY